MSDSLDVVRRVLADPTNPGLVHELVSDESVCVSQRPRLLAD